MIRHARLILLGSLAALAIGCGAAGEAPPAHPSNDPLDGISAEELYRRGVALGEVGDYIRAEQYINAAIERGYPEEEAMPALMQACVAASRLAAALQYAEPYLSRHPAHWSLRLLVASIHMGLAHHERARDELQQVLRDAPEEPPTAHYFLGVLFRDELADMDVAREHFRRYLALAPDGSHREEALMALPAEERGGPTRIESGARPSNAPERVEAPDTSSDGATP